MGRLKLLLMASACLLLAEQASAQYAGEVYGGILGGATYSELRGGLVDTDWRWGGTAGLFSAWRPQTNTVVSIEASWIQKGGEDVRLDYIEIPFLIGGALGAAEGKVRARVYTGAAVAFKIGCSSDTTSASCDVARSPEWSWPIGLTITRWGSRGFIGLDVRYSVGLNDTFETSAARNRSWQFRMLFGKPTRNR